MTATGDTPITYSETGALPSGVTLAADGTLAGTPAFATAGSYPITVTATDANSNSATQSFALTVTAGGPVFTSAASTSFAENSAGTFSVTANGDTPITYSETGALPSGVTLAANGTLAGTPGFATAGSFPITITATDANSSTSTQAFTLTVTAGGPVFASAASTSFAENSAGTFSVTANGDTPITYSETGALPSGVTLAANGTLAGTPGFATAGSFPITVTATDANSNTATQSFTLTVTASAPLFTSASSTGFAENSAGTFSVTASGDTPITFTETGALPSGVTLASNGTLAGTPAFGTAGTFPITITATDGNAHTSTQAFTLTVTASAPVFTSAASTSISENHAGTFSVTASGDTPITFTETGALPSGVTLASNGTLAGTPAFGTAGTFPITITATDGNAHTSTQAFTLTVTASAPVFTSAASTTFTVANAGTFSVAANGDAPITFTETGALPSGVTLAANGTLAGTPASGTTGSYAITVKAADGHSATTNQSFTLTVAPAPATNVTSPTTGSNERGTVVLDAGASSANGITKVQFEITGGTYNHTVIGTATASIYGYLYSWNTTTVPDGSYTLQSVATDSLGNVGTSAGVTLVVDNTAPTTSVTAPTAGSITHGTATVLDAAAADNVSVSQVQFVLTGGTYSHTVIGTATISLYGYLYSWNTTTVPDGLYTLQSLATDEAGNTTYSAGITIRVDNTPPTTAVTTPTSGATESGTAATLGATASDNVSVSQVQFVLTGGTYNKTLIGTATLSGSTWTYSWNSKSVPNGTYTLQSLATDEVGNTTYSPAVTIKVHN